MASRGINKVIIVGNLGNPPEIKPTSTGSTFATLSVATSESWRDRESGQVTEQTEWHRVVIFGKLAEIAGQYLRKGSKVYIEGKLKTRKWQDNQGSDRYTTEVVVDINGQLQILDRKPEESSSANYQQNSAASYSSEHPSSQQYNDSPSRQRTQPMNQNENTNFASPNHKMQNQRQQNNEQAPAKSNKFDEFDDDIPF